MKARTDLIDRSHELSLRKQSKALSIPRSRLYYKSLGESAENLELMRLLDKLYLSDPTLGVLGMQDELWDRGLNYNVKRIRRLLRKMCIEAIYPKRNLSRLGLSKYIHPYLLRNLAVTRVVLPIHQTTVTAFLIEFISFLKYHSAGFRLPIPWCLLWL